MNDISSFAPECSQFNGIQLNTVIEQWIQNSPIFCQEYKMINAIRKALKT